MHDPRTARLVAEHVERGFDHFGRRNLLEAIAEWEAALQLDPGNAHIRECIQYLRDNFEDLADPMDEAPTTLRHDSFGGGETRPIALTMQRQLLEDLAVGWHIEEEPPAELP